MMASNDSTVRVEADTYFSSLDALTERQAKAIEDAAGPARTVRIRGMHYIFASHG